MEKIESTVFENALMNGAFDCVYIVRDTLKDPQYSSIRQRLDYLMHGRLTSALEEVGGEKISVFLSGINDPTKGMVVLEPETKVKKEKVLSHLEGLRPKNVCFLGVGKDLISEIETLLKKVEGLSEIPQVSYIQNKV